MRTYDFSPLFRATVGFDQVANLMDRVLASETTSQSYPPYNIEKTADDSWRISLAAAGFAEDDLTVEQRETELVIAARKGDETGERNWLHRGIATRAFERRFHLAAHVRVTSATYENGMLNVDLVREVPE
ncbi:MAG: Hsp20 family protein, partial [Deltaproteobacteria bacterium]